MYRRYGYSFKYDRGGSDPSTNLRFVIGFIGMFVVLPLLFIGWLLASPTSERGVELNFFQVSPVLIILLVLLVCGLLNYIAVDYPVFGYRSIMVCSLLLVGLACFGTIIASANDGWARFGIYQVLVLGAYEFLILVTAKKELTTVTAANKARSSDA